MIHLCIIINQYTRKTTEKNQTINSENYTEHSTKKVVTTISPYPRVVAETKAYHKPSPKDLIDGSSQLNKKAEKKRYKINDRTNLLKPVTRMIFHRIFKRFIRLLFLFD